MILQSLNQLYDRLEADPLYGMPPSGFSRQKIGYRVILNPDGTLVEIQDARKLDPNKKLRTVQMLVPGTEKPPGLGVNPCFLWDNTTYMLGCHHVGKSAQYGLERFEGFKRLHLSLEDEIDNPQFSTVCRFLEQWSPKYSQYYSILSKVEKSFGIFQLNGEDSPVHESARIRNWWLKRHLEKEPSQVKGQCMVTGSMASLARLHPKIKGIIGAQSTGSSLVTCNDSSYESYGKLQSYNAPISEVVAQRYTSSLNSLLNGPLSKKHKIFVGDMTILFWTDHGSLLEDTFADLLNLGSQASQVEDSLQKKKNCLLLNMIKWGDYSPQLGGKDTQFHIAGISPNASRLVIRFYIKSTIERMIKHLHRFQSELSINNQNPDLLWNDLSASHFPALWEILRETTSSTEDTSADLSGSIFKAITEGEPYPDKLLFDIIKRIRKDKFINAQRVSLIKAILIRNYRLNITAVLDPDNAYPAYILGRLFALVEKNDEDARQHKYTNIRRLFYVSASTIPSVVFPRILTINQYYLSTLSESIRFARISMLQKFLKIFMTNGFPNHLSMQDQGVFATAYFLQRCDFFKEIHAFPESMHVAA